MDEDQQTTEVRQTNEQVGNTNVQRETVRKNTSVPTGVLARRIVYYIGGVIIALLVVRFVFLMLGANQGSPFVDFIYGLSGVFVAPFAGIFGEPKFGVSYFETSSLVAILIYALLTVGIGKLFTLGSKHDA
jgi:uncharacterized membrane protein